MIDHRRDERGFTLIEVLVAIIFTTIVLTAIGSGLAIALQTEKDMISRHRAQTIADATIEQVMALPVEEIGLFQDDEPTVDRINPPLPVCRATNYNRTTCNENLYVYKLPSNRPTTGYVPMPQAQRTVQYDDSARGGARREYDVQVVTTSYNKSSTSMEDFTTTGEGTQTRGRVQFPDSVIATVSWQESGKAKQVAVRRELSNSVTENCTPGTICLGWSMATTGGAVSDAWRRGTGTITSPDGVPATLSGTTLRTAGPLVYHARILPRRDGVLNASRWQIPSSVTIKPLGSATAVPMVPAGYGKWTYTVPTGTVMTIGMAGRTTVEATGWSYSGTDQTRSIYHQPFLTTTVAGQIRGVGTTGAALPGPLGTPTGSLRLNPAETDTLSGTVTPRLCTKTDGSLWFNQKFYVDIAGVDLQDWAASAPTEVDLDFAFRAHTPASTLANQTPNTFVKNNFRSSSKSWAVRYVGLISGSAARGSLTPVYRYSVLFPTPAFATSKAFTHAIPSPKFFSKNIDLRVSVERPYDGKHFEEIITIPVYRSTSGTSTDCVSGTASQPTY